MMLLFCQIFDRNYVQFKRVYVLYDPYVKLDNTVTEAWKKVAAKVLQYPLEENFLILWDIYLHYVYIAKFEFFDITRVIVL